MCRTNMRAVAGTLWHRTVPVYSTVHVWVHEGHDTAKTPSWKAVVLSKNNEYDPLRLRRAHPPQMRATCRRMPKFKIDECSNGGSHQSPQSC